MTSSELVWDENGVATATSGPHLLRAGEGTEWSPAVLLATAAGASLLDTFIALARDTQVPILGYVAQHTAHVESATGDLTGLVITASISVPSEEAALRARELWNVATKSAPVLRVLRCAVRSEVNIVVLCDDVLDVPAC